MHHTRHIGLVVFVLVCFFGAYSTRNAKALTADELAEHLGVEYWETVIEAQPGSQLTVYLAKVEKGKITPESSSRSFIAAAVNHIAIMASRSPEGLRATIGCDGSHSESKLQIDLPSAWIHLPPRITSSGDYVLGGDYHEKDNNIKITGKAADIEKNGLVVHIDFQAPGAK